MDENYQVLELPVSSPRKVLIAIRAARSVKKWGYYAALRYCQKRGVAAGVLDVALWCRKNENDAAERLPAFLRNQAY